jgi:hypothetical protein
MLLFQMFGLPLAAPKLPDSQADLAPHGHSAGQLVGPGVAQATLCNGPDPFGYTCTVVSRSYISGTSEITGSDGSSPQVGLYCDSCQILDAPLPFSFSFYGQSFTSYNATTDGTIQFFSSYNNTPITALPHPFMSGLIAPYWDDLCTDDTCTAPHLAPTTLGNGVFVKTTGVAPNRLYIVEWRAHAYDFFALDPNAPLPPDTFFEVQLEETTNNIYFVYGPSPTSGLDSLGGGATAGIQDDGAFHERPIRFLQYSNHAANLTKGTAVCFSTTAGCPAAALTATPTQSPTATPSQTGTAISTTTVTPTAVDTQTPTITTTLPSTATGTITVLPTATPTVSQTLTATPTITPTLPSLQPISIGLTITPTATVTPTPTAVTGGPPRDDKDAKSDKKTDEQKLHETRSNTGGFDQYETEGNVVDVDYTVSPPIAYIANRDTPPNATRAQLVAVVLACPGGCPTVRPGDYIEVAGEKVHEQLYIAEGISFSHP